MSRVFEQAAPGEDWKLSNDHTIKFDYLTNSTYEVKRLKVIFDNGDTEKPLLISDDYYLKNELYKNIVKDENWNPEDNLFHTTEEFKDKQGRVILKRTYADVAGSTHNENRHDTYYVYDDFGNLTFVIPPLAADSVFDETTTGTIYNTNLTDFPPSAFGLSGSGDVTVGIIDMGNGTHEYSIDFNLTGLTGFLTLGDVITLPNAENLSDNFLFTIKDELSINGYTFKIIAGKINIVNRPNPYVASSIQKNNSFVLPTSNGSSTYTLNTNVLDDLCYQYKYDHRNRLVEKKIPGKGWEYIVYNTLDQPVLTQDAEMRLAGKWLFTKYDALGRVAYTGIYNNTDNRLTMQTDVNNSTILFETRSYGEDAVYNLSGGLLDYSMHAFPDFPKFKKLELLTVSYYDDYEWKNQNGGVEASYEINRAIPGNFSWDPNTNTLIKTAGYAWNNATFETQNKIQGDGYLQYTVNGTDNQRSYIGLANTNEIQNTSWTTINYGILTGVSTDKKIRIVEEGVNVGIPVIYYETGDVFRIERSGTQILFKKNGKTFYVSGVPSIGELVGDGVLVDQYSSMSNIHIGYSSYGQQITDNVKGLPTGSLVRTLETVDWTITSSYYDVKGNPIHTTSDNDYLDTHDVVSSQIDFVGKILKTKTSHIKGANNAIVTEDFFYYDHAGRLITQEQQLNSGDKQLITTNHYDELGQLEQKQVGRAMETMSTSTNIVGVTIFGNTITKTAANGWGNAGLSTVNNITGDGYVTYMPTRNVHSVMVGLSYADTNQHYNTIDYAIYTKSAGIVRVYEGGSNKGDKTTYVPGDIFRIERIGTTVYYLKNNDVFYTSSKGNTGATMVGDISLYNLNSEVKNFAIVDTEKSLQTVDYTYNIRGWLKNINDVNTIGNDLFAFNIKYNDITDPAKKLYNGNISQTNWNTAGVNTTGNPISNTYTYKYDALNRITSGLNPGNDHYDLTSVGYDKNGNILNLERRGHTDSGATVFDTMDDLSYHYNGNQLHSVTDSSSITAGFNDGNISDTDFSSSADNDFIYDVNGNMKTDANKGITNIQYNHLNLPTFVEFTGTDKNITYIYDATGIKLQKIVNDSGTLTTTNYAGNYVYEETLAGEELKFFNQPEGYIEYDTQSQTFGYIYQYKDHLGNIRLSYSDYNGDGNIVATSNPNTNEIVEENHYYPFGLKHKGYNSNIVSEHKYKFQGQELEEALGLDLYEFELRQYDPALGRFMTTDPYEQFASPYIAMGNNPVVAFDPDGGLCYDSNGNTIACPDSDIFDDYRDNDDNHMYIEDEVVVTANSNDDSNTVNIGVDEGTQIADRNSSVWSKIWSGISPRTVNVNGIYYSVNDNGEVTGFAPKSGLGAAELLGGFYNPKNLLRVANLIDKGGLTKIGKALQKHASRPGSKFGSVSGNPASLNAQGEKILNSILTNSASTTTTRHHARFGDIVEIVAPNGQGARFSKDGQKFIGLIEK